jgi:hypothetical protein
MADKLIAHAPPNNNTRRKISILNNNNIKIILAGSGYKDSYDEILSIIGSINPFTNEIVETINNYIRDYLRRIAQVGGITEARAKGVEFYILKKNHNWTGYLFSNAAIIPMTIQPHSIGKGTYAIKPHLSVNTYSKTVNDAILYGLHLIKYASIGFDRDVGDPQILGCDYVVLNNNSDLPQENYDYIPPMMNIERMLYRFEG